VSGSCPPPRPDIEIPPGLTPADAALLSRLARPTRTGFERLNPITKATFALVTTLGAFVTGGYVIPLVLLAGSAVAAARAQVLRPAVRRAALVSLPIVVSLALVTVLAGRGQSEVVPMDTVALAMDRLDAAARLSLRVIVGALALTVFAMTTDPRALIADLQRRGLPARLTFAVSAAIDAVPAMVDRARTVAAAQRARGLNTEGSIGARLRGIPALVGPVLLSSIGEVDERAMALEVRGFDRPGRRVLLWTPADSPGQRAARWLMLVGLIEFGVAQAAGLLAWIP
jgi:energy-coupling factor transport system permease protein